MGKKLFSTAEGVQVSKECFAYFKIICMWKYQIYIILMYLNQFPDDKILDWSKLKEVADDILKCIYHIG